MFPAIIRSLTLILLSFMFISCASEDDTTTPALAIDSTNAEEVGTAVVEGLKNVVASDSAPSSIPGSLRGTPDSRIDASYLCGSGSADYTVSSNGSSGTLTYTNCTYSSGGYSITYNGSMSFSYSSTSYSISYNNFTFTDSNGYSESFSGSLSCTTTASSYDCDYSTTVASGSVSYSVSNTSLTGDATSGYSASYTMTSSTYGTITVTTTSPITFNCTNGYPDSGEISFTGENGSSGSLTFDNCSSYTITINGVGTSYNW